MDDIMRKKIKQIIALICLICLSASLCLFTVSAEEDYVAFPVYLDGLLTSRGYEIEGEDYISLKTLDRVLTERASVTRDDAAKAYTVSVPGVEMIAVDNMRFMTANGRYLYLPNGVVKIKDNYYLPADIISRVLNIEISYGNGGRKQLFLDTDSMQPLMDGDTYYSTAFSQEDAYWLSKIIFAEASNHSMKGHIGVGNVVQNRVLSDKYPNTIKDVVFDTDNGYQFQPVMTGDIYDDPDQMSVIAAYLCLEGYNVVEDSLFFVEPLSVDDTWFKNALRFVVKIDTHDFYALKN